MWIALQLARLSILRGKSGAERGMQKLKIRLPVSFLVFNCFVGTKLSATAPGPLFYDISYLLFDGDSPIVKFSARG